MKRRKILCALMATVILISCLFLTSCDDSGEKVYIFSYGDYYDPEIVSEFEEETGIEVVQNTYDTAEELYPIIKNGSADYDVICTSDYMVEKLAKEGLLFKLNYKHIPNIKNIDNTYMDMAEEFDPGNNFSVPHTVGTAGIIYNKKMVGNERIDSWDDLWNKNLKNYIVMPDSVRDDFMIALRKNGYSQNTVDESQIKIAAADLKKQKPFVYKYANDATRDLLVDGSAAIGVVWNGEYIYTKELNKDVEFVIPKEGTEFFMDSWVIPKSARNKENAEKWLDFLCRADIAKKNFDYLYYTTPNKAAMDQIDSKYTENEAIFPSKETLEKCECLKSLDSDETELYSKYWKKVKAF